MPQGIIYFYCLLIQNPLILKKPVIEGSCSEKFVGITIDNKFTFEKHKVSFLRNEI